jgi:hypothetical protein
MLVARLRHDAEPQVVKALRPPGTLVRVMVAGENPIGHDYPQVVGYGLRLQPCVEPIQEAFSTHADGASGTLEPGQQFFAAVGAGRF